ncbi:MAG: YIP1 family protein, partial [Rhodobacteraceae bacterium]|nr:YIP1 family protein [Paracoccaceae bacterium]
MGVVSDIVATYRQPRRVMRRLLSMGKREDRALAFVMAGCTVVFMSQWPVLARQAHLEKQ